MIYITTGIIAILILVGVASSGSKSNAGIYGGDNE